MPEDFDIEAIARAVEAAQDNNRQIEPITDRKKGFGLADGYEVAHRIHAARLAAGAVVMGRKIGFTNSNIWPKYGVDAPIWGYVYDSTIVRAGGGRASCPVGRYAEPKIEPEIVVHLRDAPPDNADTVAILACVDWVAHAFEIVQSHYPGWRFRAPDTVADSALHAALILGEPVAVEHLGDNPAAALASFSITLLQDGTVVESGTGANVLGGPLQATAHLAATLAGQPQYPALEAGEIITTGTLTGAYSVEPGQTWSTELAGIALPGLKVDIET